VKEFFLGWTIGSPCDLVDRGALGISPTLWQLLDPMDFVIDDRMLLNRRPHNTKTITHKQVQKNLKIVLIEPADRMH
jgi:hypothetical protein